MHNGAIKVTPTPKWKYMRGNHAPQTKPDKIIEITMAHTLYASTKQFIPRLPR